MRPIRLAAMSLGFAVVLAGCRASAPDGATTVPSTSARPEASAPASPASIPSMTPEPSVGAPATAGPSPGPAALEVRDAAIATLAAGSLTFDVEVRAQDPDSAIPPVTGSGQVSFGEPRRFRFASPGTGPLVPPSEVIADVDRIYTRGRDTSYLPPDTWVVLEVAGDAMWDVALRQYGNYTLLLVPPLGVTAAEAGATEELRGETMRHYIALVDVAAARDHLPDQLLDAFDAQAELFRRAGTVLTHEVDVWVDEGGHVARMRYVTDVQSSDVGPIVVTYDLSDFGGPLDLAPAEGDEVLTLDEARERYLESVATPSPR